MRENQKRLTMLTNSNLRTHNQFEHVTQTRLAKENQQLLWSSGARHTTVPENICRVGTNKTTNGEGTSALGGREKHKQGLKE